MTFDPRELCWTDADTRARDPRTIVAIAVDLDISTGEPPPGGKVPIPGKDIPVPVPQDVAVAPFDVQQVYCRWQFANAQVREGAYGVESRILNVQLNQTAPVELSTNVRVTGGTAASTDFELRTPDGQVSSEAVSVRFPRGALSAPVIVWVKSDASVEGEETIELTLDATGESAFPAGSETPYRVVTNTGYGQAVLTIAAIDTTAPPVPEWRWTAGTAISVPEAIGTFPLEISLDGPSTTDVHIRVTSEDGSPAAVAGTNYVAVDETVIIPAGQLYGSVNVTVLYDPTVIDGSNLEFDLTGEVILGNCSDPSADTISVAIEDTGIIPNSRTVQWVAATVSVTEPETVAGQATSALFAVASTPFDVQTDVPFVRTETNTALGLGYNLTSGANVPFGVVRFLPNNPLGRVFFTPLANGISGNASVELELQDGATYDVGTNDTLTITILENSAGVVEPTFIAARRGLGTGRTLVEATMAVEPPSETLPRYYVVGTNDDCQVVGMTRNSQGRWDAVRVIAAAPDDAASDALGGAHSSYPGDASTTPIEIALGAGGSVAEDGAYPAQSFTGLRPTVVPCNVLGIEFQRELTDSLASSTTAIVPQWVGPTGAMFPQVGPDLVRIEYYRVTLRNSTLTNEDGPTDPGANTRCMSVEMWIKRRVDCDVVEVQGVLTNTNWDKTQNLRTSNTRTNGVAHLRSFYIENVPSGWAATWGTATSLESFSGSTVTLLPSRTESYKFAPTASMAFRFALYNTSTSSAAQAQRVLRCQGIGTSTGHYGVTRRNVWGARGDALVDPVRAGYNATWSGTQYNGWRAYEETAARLISSFRTGWNAGTAVWPFLDARASWMHAGGPKASGSPSGDLVNGLTALLPSSGYWERSWYQLVASVSRNRVGAKDVLTGDEAWQKVLVDAYATNGLAPWIQGGSDRKGYHRLPQFNTTQLTDFHLAIINPAESSAMRAAWILAPTTRPWNVSTPECAADPSEAIVDHELPTSGGAYEHTDFQHCSRYAEQIEDGWWGLWSPIAWWQSMHLGAWVSRGMSAHRTDPAFSPVAAGRFQELDYHPAFNLYWAEQTGSPLEKGGVHLGSAQSFTGTGWRPSGNMRSFPLACLLMAQTYSMAGDRQRALIVEPGGVSWFREWARFMTRFSTPVGLWAVSDGSNLDPKNAANWGPTNLPARTGALPSSWSTAFMFHQNWNAYAAWTCLIRAFRSQDSEMTLAVRKLLRIPWFVRESAKVHTPEQGRRGLGLFAVVARGSFGSGVGGAPEVPTEETWLADYWHDFSQGLNETVNSAVGYQLSKFGGCVYAWREARDNGDPDAARFLSPMLALFEVPEEDPDLGYAFRVAWGIEPGINAQGVLQYLNGGNSGNPVAVQLHGEHTWYMPWLADMLNAST